MSNAAIEKLLWQASVSPPDAAAFRSDPDAWLGQFRLDDEEKALVKGWDVAALADRGVNPMVMLMAFSAVTGTTDMMEYVTRINRPR